MFIEEVINHLYSILAVEKRPNITLIRLHTKKLQTLGEFSFPLDITRWKHVLSSNCSEKVSTILEYVAENNKDFVLQSLCAAGMYFYKTEIIGSNVHLYLNRLPCYSEGIREAFDPYYGRFNMNAVINLISDVPKEKNVYNINISDFRVVILKRVARNVLLFNKCTITDNKAESQILFSRRPAENSEDYVLIRCGPVLLTSGDTTVKAFDYHRYRVIDMRLMAEHKYGVRVSRHQNWRRLFEKLGTAAVMIELMENNPSHSLKLDVLNPTLTCQKNTSFIMYNCARLATILKEFSNRTSTSNIYPKLSNLDEINWELLKEPEEWDLLFIYVLQFPRVVKSVVKDIQSKGKFNPHYLVAFLSGLSSTFSRYYGRVQILCEPRTHLLPTMYARIYLLEAVQHVMHNALELLDIEPISEM